MPALRISYAVTQRLSRFVILSVILMSIVSGAPTEAQVDKQVLRLDGQDIAVPTYLWSDTTSPAKAVLIGLHGGVQHGGNYEALAQKLAPQGIVFYSIDFRGHGNWLTASEKRPKVDYDATARDLVKVAQQLRERYAPLPLFCVGESLGVAVALKAISIDPKLFDGMILASAGIRPATKHHVFATLQSIGEGIKTLGGTIDVSPHLKGISDDARSSNEMIADPLGRRKSSVWSLLHTVNFLHSAHKLAPKIGDIPVLVMQGDSDQIINADSTRAFFSKLGTKNKAMKTFANVGHLLVTTQYLKPAVVMAVQDWLFAQVDSQAVAIHRKALQPAASPPG